MKHFAVLPLAGLLALGDVSSFAQQQPTAATPQPAPAATAPSGAVETPRPALANTLMDGTAISLRIAETISSEDAHTGRTCSLSRAGR